MIHQKWRSHAVFETPMQLASALHYLPRKPHQPTQRTTAMKFEAMMLNSLFVVCTAICVSVLTAMLA
ncbi:hypothetical protein IHE46_12535 [Rhodanobacter sp. DHG33]|nr:hypothetical protein [Rhodanobacter sp. DHG33]